MAGKITDLPAIPAIDRAVDVLEIVDVSANASYSVTPNALMGISSVPLGTTDVQSPTNKTFDNTNALTVKDTNFTLQDDGDTSKQVKFQNSGITTATTRTFTWPDRSSTVATLGGNQVFTGANSFTGSTWSGGTIDNATVTIDSVAGHTSSTTGTIYGISVSAGVLSLPSMPTGTLQQMVSTKTGTVATGTTTIPVDNTVPQNTEGDQYMSLAITPKSATNSLVIQVKAVVSTHIVNGAVGALFQDSTAGALAATMTRIPAIDADGELHIVHQMMAGTTSSTTFKFRAGPQSADTLTFNGSGSGQLFGGITLSSIVIWEVKA